MNEHAVLVFLSILAAPLVTRIEMGKCQETIWETVSAIMAPVFWDFRCDLMGYASRSPHVAERERERAAGERLPSCDLV